METDRLLPKERKEQPPKDKYVVMNFYPYRINRTKINFVVSLRTAQTSGLG